MYQQDENDNDVEKLTIDDVITNLVLVQDIKLLHLQTVFFNHKDVLITKFVNKNTLLRILEKYRAHYSRIKINQDNILIKNLCELSFLRVGLEKDTLKLIDVYF